MTRHLVCPTATPRPGDNAAARVEAISSHPTFLKLTMARTRLGLSLAAVMVVLYFSYILTVALRPAVLGTPVFGGAVVTWGVVAGVALLSLGFVLTAIYVSIANRHFDDLTESLREDMQ